jgi:hypothetical protein
MRVRSFLVIAVAGLAGPALAAQKAPSKKATPSPSPAASPSPVPTPSPVPMSPACSAPQHRQFDFWLGEWDLVGNDGKKSAEDRVVQVLGGCALQENWTAVKSGQGLSFSAYDPATKRWHQTLIGQRPSQKEKGVTITHRIAWSLLPDHRVRQYWEASTNGGRTWRPVFEGTYVPRK